MSEQPQINLDEFNTITEGQGTILFPKKENVFYNPIQQFNRDLSVLAIRSWSEMYLKDVKVKNRKKRKSSEIDQTNEVNKTNDDTKNKEEVTRESNNEKYEISTFKPKINIIEALSATGLRAIRYAKEIPNIGTVLANDLLPAAVENIDRNILHNEVGVSVKSVCGDANATMHAHASQHFQVVDLDPYGTAAPFIDAAVQSIDDGGLLLVTCTDLSVLAGQGYPEKCFALYGGTNLRSDATHESALRLVISMVASSAAKYRKSVEPLLSLSIDFYVRVFIRIKTSPIEVKNLANNTMTCYLCSGCGAYTTQRLGRAVPKEDKPQVVKYSWSQGPPVDRHCEYCSRIHHVCGPMWAGDLHNAEFCDKILQLNEEVKESEVYKTHERIKGMVTLAKNELDGSAPFYFSPSRVSSIIKIPCPSITNIVAGIGNAGYKASLTHAAHGAIKTDAPWDVIWKIFKDHVKEKGLVTEETLAKMNQNTVGYKLLTNDKIKPDLEVKFDKNSVVEGIEKLRKVKIVRYQMNPTKNWGPKAKPQ
ncbi:tRNA (guanine26-N2)-dimethyltransferase [Saccharomycopsis crataegensis]|uniref:tRNA (guanine(26)-N(2))-dimethyltransferase n=1 Tax=Saccharomycopsis crataegensis TaxID=43959 RepID=A0AAV5QQK5_9ASCO|nr:tRNA (guanine26-N2)-dimethyltransferase [Saccharomycopsis crataegensis]